jgi:hypothetical protein
MSHTINVPLARRVLDQIMAAPARWRQGIWLERPYPLGQQSPENTVDNCETTGCFAGWTVVLAGHKTGGSRVMPDTVSSDLRAVVDRLFGHPDYPGVVDLSVRTVAAARLGLTGEQANRLFDGNNTLRTIYAYLSEWTDGEIAIPDPLPAWADRDSDELADHFYALADSAE